MSRHAVPSFDARYEIAVGWDRPLNSYFAQVEDMHADDDEDPVVVWVGAGPSEIQTPEALRAPIAAYGTLTDEMISTLAADRAATLDRGNSPLQRDGLAAIAKLPKT